MCDTLCIVAAGRIIFGKNSDRPRDEAQVAEALPRRAGGGRLRTTHHEIDDDGALAVLGSRPTWMWGLEHGVNERGVAIGNERVYTVAEPSSTEPGLIGADLVRLGLERGPSAEQAVDVITDLVEHHGQGGSGRPDRDEPYCSSFLVADRDAAWVLETSGRSWAAAHRPSGAAISNGLTLGTDWTRASPDVAAGSRFDARRDPDRPTGPADRRRATTAACVARAPTDAAALRAALRDHGASTSADVVPPLPTAAGGDEAWTVCLHQRELGLATTASLIAELRAPDAPIRGFVALGSPCASVYVPVFPPESVPVLAEAATWSRFASLRDQVEADPGALPAVRAVLDPLERSLAEQADAASASTATRAAYAESAGVEIGRALERLGA